MRLNTFAKLVIPSVVATFFMNSGIASAQDEEKATGTDRYLQLNLLSWKQVRGETELKTSSTNKAPVKNTDYGIDQTDSMEVGVFGKSAFITAGIEKPTNFSLALGWKNSAIMAGLELEFASSTAEKTQFLNGAEIKTTTNTANSNYGVVGGFIMAQKSFTAIIKGRFGLAGSDKYVETSQSKTITADISGMYFGLGLDYARKFAALGPNVSIAHGFDYVYARATDKNPVDTNNLDIGESKVTSHTWSINLAALRLHF